jgi:putative membrane protein
MAKEILEKSKKYTKWIWVLSILIPIVVALLFSVRIPGVERIAFLPPLYASINAIRQFY